MGINLILLFVGVLWRRRGIPLWIGAEIEALITDSEGNPVNFYDWLKQRAAREDGKALIELPWGSITHDLGIHQVEFQPKQCFILFPWLLAYRYWRLYRWLSIELERSSFGLWRIECVGDAVERLRAACNGKWWHLAAPSDRYQPLIDALQQEAKRLGQNHLVCELVMQVMAGNAVHLHVSGPGMNPLKHDSAAVLLTALGHEGFRWGERFTVENDLGEPGRQSKLWHGWGVEARLPSYRHVFRSAGDVRRHYEQLPQLIRQDEEGKTHIDLETPGSADSPLHRGNFWLLARPASAHDGSEYRGLPSMGPWVFWRCVCEFAKLVLSLMWYDRTALIDEREWGRLFFGKDEPDEQPVTQVAVSV